jgi:hypothetical protein
MADAEFTTDNEAQSFLPPTAAVAEVTNDSRFTGGSLVSAERHDLLAWLADYSIELQQTEWIQPIHRSWQLLRRPPHAGHGPAPAERLTWTSF